MFMATSQKVFRKIVRDHGRVYAHTIKSLIFSFIFPSHLLRVLSSPFYSLPPSRDSDPGSHSRLFSLPTHYGSCLEFHREKISALSSLVDSRRIVLTHARRSQQLILFFIRK